MRYDIKLISQGNKSEKCSANFQSEKFNFMGKSNRILHSVNIFR